MRLRPEAGVWEIFIPRIGPGEFYKYEVVHRDGAIQPWKADPLARATECPPRTASIVAPALEYVWSDRNWMARRARRQSDDAPISIYEVHILSWLIGRHAGEANWAVAADLLIPYVQRLGFTHIELLPIAEYPFGGSWGYQPLALFAPTARMGDAQAFAAFVDRCHAADIGVIVDWVPGHFPSDDHGIARFDGTALYEHEDREQGFHIDWNTLIYNFGRHEVQGFLIASAIHWLEHFHLDGLRVDAVASMLYRDYSRKHGEWTPNIHGGRENLEAVAFLKHFNAVVHERCPGAITIAEESTSWPGVTAPLQHGGLGFDYKWNMGWMNDTLRYMARDPIHRRHHHEDITFGLAYAFSERFVLPLSHDEVVHGKGSLIGKMPGDAWQRMANLRALYALMWSHPGKKLLFMGAELAQDGEWSADNGLDWRFEHERPHLARMLADLNRLYRTEPALHVLDAAAEGFRWMIADDRANSVFAFTRHAREHDATLLVVANMTPVPRFGYACPAPAAGPWHEIFNSDSAAYGGANIGNGGGIAWRLRAQGDLPAEVQLTLPPLGVIVLRSA